MNTQKINKLFQIKDLETLRAISDPLRVQIVELLTGQSLTIKQVADKLGLAPSKLYYHFATLEKLGLIEVAETRTVANILEKVFTASADGLDIDPALFRFSKEGDNEPFITALASMMDATREDIIRSLQARQFQLQQGAPERSRRFIINRVISRIPEARVQEFQERLVKLLHEFERENDASARGSKHQPYALTVAFYPSFYYEIPKKPRKT